VKHPKFFEIFGKYDGYKKSNIKLKKPKQLQVNSLNGNIDIEVTKYVIDLYSLAHN
jgi:hypothetical protein